MLLVFGTAGTAKADLKVGMSVGNEGSSDFYLAMSEYNRVPERVLIGVRDRGIPDEQIPVVMFIAARAQVAPDVIVKMRHRHMSWMEIAAHFRLGVDAFYVPLNGNLSGTVYERPYRFFKQDRRHWNRIHLTDEDVVNLVDLKFVSDYHGYRPDDVIRFRANGRNFVNIHNDIRMEREKREGRDHRNKGDNRGGMKHGHDEWNDKGGNRDDRHNDNGDMHNNGNGDKRDDNGNIHSDRNNGSEVVVKENSNGVSLKIALDDSKKDAGNGADNKKSDNGNNGHNYGNNGNDSGNK
jgi:hypothetical protein